MGSTPSDSLRFRVRPRATFACASLALASALLWQFLNVRYNYGGNWTGLFCIGDRSSVPPSLANLHLYRFPQSDGYDGQLYYYVAQDPFLRGEFKEYVDNPPLRWRRILLPALAHALGVGRRNLIAPAYIGIVLASIFAGAWWLGEFCQSVGRHTFWGLSFLMIPGVAVSLDRMTVDVVLAALCVAFAVYGVAAPSWKIYPVLCLAPLARETGLALVLAFCLFCVTRRRIKEALMGAAMALPWAAWALFVRVRLWSDGTQWMSGIPFGGFFSRMLHPIQFEVTGRWLAIAALLDYAALLGLGFALFLAVGFVWQRRFGLLELATAVFAFSIMFVAKEDVWAQAYAFGRTMSPLLIWPAMIAVSTQSWWLLLPLAVNTLRIAQQIVTISIPFARGLLIDALNFVR